MQEMQVWPWVGEDSLEEGMATHTNILAWRIPWTEEPGGVAKSWTRLKQLSTYASCRYLTCRSLYTVQMLWNISLWWEEIGDNMKTCSSLAWSVYFFFFLIPFFYGFSFEEQLEGRQIVHWVLWLHLSISICLLQDFKPFKKRSNCVYSSRDKRGMKCMWLPEFSYC